MKSVLSVLAMGSIFISFSALAALAAPVSAGQERINDLKREIVEIATENQENLKNFSEVRAALEPLVSELVTFENKTFEQQTQFKIGAWRQLWTDDADDVRRNNFIQTVDRTKTYQVVFNDGIFYNVSEIKTPLGVFTGFLRGKYEAQSPRFVLEFTDVKVRRGGVDQSSVSSFIQKAKAGTLGGLFRIPGERPYPNGPVGAKGDTESVYIDDTLRIDEGRNFADGVVDLFVLVREK